MHEGRDFRKSASKGRFDLNAVAGFSDRISRHTERDEYGADQDTEPGHGQKPNDVSVIVVECRCAQNEEQESGGNRKGVDIT